MGDLDRLSDDQLKMLLKGRKLPVSGTRQQMLKRLESKGASKGGKSKGAAGKAKKGGAKPPSTTITNRMEKKKEVNHLATIVQQNVTTQQLVALLAAKMGSKPDHEVADAVVKRMKENGASKDDVKQVRAHPVSVVAMSVLSIVGAYFVAHRLDPEWTEAATDKFMTTVVQPVMEKATAMIAYWKNQGKVYAGMKVWDGLKRWVDESVHSDSAASKYVPLTVAGATGIGAMALTGISLPFVGLLTVATLAAPTAFAVEGMLEHGEAAAEAAAEELEN